MAVMISGSMLRDLLKCERRFELDLKGPPERRDKVSDFVRMLWEGGSRHEDAVVAGLQGRIVDLRAIPGAERVGMTRAAIAARPDWIVGGRLEVGDRMGVPDLLRWDGVRWYAGDVKSGAALEDRDRPRMEYAVQVGHYGAIVADLGLGDRDRAFVVGRDGETVWYDLASQSCASGSINSEVDRLVDEARRVCSGETTTRPALSSACSLCHWRTVCREELDAGDDLTLVAGLGRSLRGTVEALAGTVTELAGADLTGMTGARAMPGLGTERLRRFRDRARLLRTPGARPYARRPLGLSRHPRELHFDIESDPLNGGLVYLHGVLDVRGREESYVPFFAEGPDDERDAFAAAFAFLTADPEAHIFYYSKFERTSYRELARRHPGIASDAAIERLFSRECSTDLLGDVVQPHTEWPTHSVGIKALAKFLGFSWRDVDPSGAASIAWFDEWSRTRDPAVRARIEAYNEDDCRATAVLLAALVDLPVASGTDWPPEALTPCGARG